MERSEVLRRFESLRAWGSGDQRAPHKPLLILFALGAWTRGESPIPFSAVNESLTNLLRDFGPPRKSYRTQDPFWRLQTEKIWIVEASAPLVFGADGSPTKASLLDGNAQGQFEEELQKAFRLDPTLIGEIARQLLMAHFPSSLHEDICNAVGLDINDERAVGGGRDPNFRRRVLTSYQHRCAVCGLQLLLSGTPIALEAAHIKWHQAAGPAIVQNGLSLCVLHHKTFDLGAFTVGSDLTVIVSDEVSGLCGLAEHLLTYHGKCLSRPIHVDAAPAMEFINWHRSQVFRGQPRPL
jgi:putative restriction endonuclease